MTSAPSAGNAFAIASPRPREDPMGGVWMSLNHKGCRIPLATVALEILSCEGGLWSLSSMFARPCHELCDDAGR